MTVRLLIMAEGHIVPFPLRICSVVRGFHVYQEIWEPEIGEHLEVCIELHNVEDKYAVALKKELPTTGTLLSMGIVTVGHIPREISKTCWHFIRRDGELSCQITGPRKRSTLLEGGLEVPCIYTFKGKKMIDKLERILG